MYSSQDLAVLVAIADTGSLRGAAAALGRTQPAITQAVQRLEETVGFALLDRSSYRARFTDRGEVFVKSARLAVGQLRGLETTAMLLARGVEPRLRIAVHGAVPTESWTNLLEGVAAQFPNTVIEVESGEGDLALKRLMDGEAEFALVLQAYPDRFGTSVESKTLGTAEFVNVVRADMLAHAEAGSTSVPHIITADFDEPTSFTPTHSQSSWRVSDHHMKSAAIIAGLGWGSIPKAIAEPLLKEGTLAALSHLGTRSQGGRLYSLYRLRDRPLGPVATFIWDAAERSACADAQLPVDDSASPP